MGRSAVVAALGAAGVRYAILREGDDLDVLVEPADLGRAADALRRAGLLARRSDRHWPHRFFVGRSDAEAAGPLGFVVVDVLDRVLIRHAMIGGRRLAAQLVAVARPDEGGVPRLAPADAAWARVVHAALKGILGELVAQTGVGPVAPDGATAPDQLAARLAEPGVLRGALDRRLPAGTCERVVAAVRAGDAATVAQLLAPLAAARWPLGSRLARARSASAARFPMPALRPSRRRRLLRGVSIALLGPDGAGKSTLAEGLRDGLPMPVRIVYMGVFRTDSRQRAWRRIPGAGLALRVSRLWWRSMVGSYYRARGHVIVFDRYVFDATLRPGQLGLRARASYWVIERSCPAPDLVLLLDAPGEVMFARKGEHDIATLETRRSWYLRLLSTLPQGTVLDATLPPAAVLEAAARSVWQAQSAG